MNIGANGGQIDLLAIVDTGAQNTLVSPQYAGAVGLDLNAGRLKEFSTANGGLLRAYGHTVRINIFGEELESEIFFSEAILNRCLLGRDILEKMQIGLKESHTTLYLF